MLFWFIYFLNNLLICLLLECKPQGIRTHFVLVHLCISKAWSRCWTMMGPFYIFIEWIFKNLKNVLTHKMCLQYSTENLNVNCISGHKSFRISYLVNLPVTIWIIIIRVTAANKRKNSLSNILWQLPLRGTQKIANELRCVKVIRSLFFET